MELLFWNSKKSERVEFGFHPLGLPKGSLVEFNKSSLPFLLKLKKAFLFKWFFLKILFPNFNLTNTYLEEKTAFLQGEEILTLVIIFSSPN